jgi:hypothetical protein
MMRLGFVRACNRVLPSNHAVEEILGCWLSLMHCSYAAVLLLTGASSGCDLQMELSGSSTLCSFQHEQRVLLPSEQVGSNRSTCIMLVLLLLNHVLFCFWFVPSSGACFCD